VSASHDALAELFEHIEKYFKRLDVYMQLSMTSEMAEVFVKMMAEVLSILSIATKEVNRKRASESDWHGILPIDHSTIWPEKVFDKLLRGTDIEDALKRLDKLIQEEVRMAVAQTMKATFELKDGAHPFRPVTHLTLNSCPTKPTWPFRAI